MQKLKNLISDMSVFERLAWVAVLGVLAFVACKKEPQPQPVLPGANGFNRNIDRQDVKLVDELPEEHGGKFGLPFDVIIEEEDFTLVYDGRTRQARWVAERLTRDKIIAENADREFSRFFEDRRVPMEFRSTLDDYKGSGYDRGHLAPAGNHDEDQDSIDSTFTLANMSPQLPEFNRQYWRHVETLIRKLAMSKEVDVVHVVTGPLFENYTTGTVSVAMHKHIGDRVVVPTGYFKALAIEAGDALHVAAYVFPHEKIESETPVGKFSVSTNELERRSGLNFWPHLIDQAKERWVGDPLGEFEE